MLDRRVFQELLEKKLVAWDATHIHTRTHTHAHTASQHSTNGQIKNVNDSNGESEFVVCMLPLNGLNQKREKVMEIAVGRFLSSLQKRVDRSQSQPHLTAATTTATTTATKRQ